MFVYTGEAAFQLNSASIAGDVHLGAKIKCLYPRLSHTNPRNFACLLVSCFPLTVVVLIDTMLRKSTNVGLKYLHLMQQLRCVSTFCCKTGKKKKKSNKKESMPAPGDLWPDSQCPEFISQKPAMYFGSDGCTLNFQTADSAAASWGRWKVAVTAGMIQGADGLCRSPPLFREGSGRTRS